MADSYIDYDAKVQDALRNVVKDVLRDTAKEGLQGEHHFYVAFKTQAEGVNIPAHLVSRFPDEMTIVLQHKFWGLEIHDDRFEIGLSFNQKPEHLIIPFEAIVGFVDPSVQFALQFHDEQDDSETENEAPAAIQSNDSTSEDDDMFLPDATEKPESPEPNEIDPDALAQEGENEPRDNVVTLDAFRKK